MESVQGAIAPVSGVTPVETFEEKAARVKREALEIKAFRKAERERKQAIKQAAKEGKAQISEVKSEIASIKNAVLKAKNDEAEARLDRLAAQKEEMNRKLSMSKAQREAEFARINARRLLNTGSRLGRQIAADRVIATLRASLAG